MRLINIFTEELKTFYSAEIPPYGILSHRWGDQEVSLKTYQADQQHGRQRQSKVTDFCTHLRDVTYTQEPVEWAWVDTCFINKESSAELTEFINSMYQWYAYATLCVVHLADVTIVPCARKCKRRCQSCRLSNQQFADSRWFRRGWTLQELIAPRKLKFVSADWQDLGLKQGPWSHRVQPFLNRITAITCIPSKF
ncbi:Vegetative incompatibility protein HET-E-1 [Fulvia fulva]|uniref:Vegetative incompatibility protein HET-E-1 n=1 Tax=Passalora fulva TaxID=5499 RepID=A0A9Q8P939_PASFU|nr:Vegetative incompatibility protein HET-E-1 [Fulvia fulva]UJO17551.1 Vegetative incompatibility protein HET-E-1 [Fulvia fulva]